MMRVEFDPAKCAKNIATRALSFDRAVDFDFAGALIEQDTRKPYPEDRFVAIGRLGDRVHVLCFTRVAAGVIRVISFRKANKKEGLRHANDQSAPPPN